MQSLSAVHYTYILITVVLVVSLLRKKEIVIPCALGIFLIGLVYTGNIITAVLSVSTALIASCAELFGIILVIALITAMTDTLAASGVIQLLLYPAARIFRSPGAACLTLGLSMSVVSLLLWPSPAVALIGALLFPAAVNCGLTPLAAACVMNIFGHGIALSGDFFIQGAPAVTASSAGLSLPEFNAALFPLWLVMSLTTAAVSFRCMKRRCKNGAETVCPQPAPPLKPVLDGKKGRQTKCLAALTVLCLTGVIAAMVFFHVIGSQATGFIAGAALLLTCVVTLFESGPAAMLGKAAARISDGFVYAIRIFAPILVIGAFFFLGNQPFAQSVFGPNAPGLLRDISFAVTARLPAGPVFAVLCQLAAGILTGMDGSGFSGLPIAGALAVSLSGVMGGNPAVLAAFGQIVTVWVGGGTLIPWAVAPVSAVCGVSPAQLARSNLIPVGIGLLVTAIAAAMML